MPVLTHVNLFPEQGVGAYDEKTDLMLIAAFNRLPQEITAENIAKREYRVWLMRLTEEINGKCGKQLDMFDSLLRLQQHRKADRLRNRGTAVSDGVKIKDDSSTST